MNASAASTRFVIAIHRMPHGFCAQVVNLPGCFAKGATEVEALENVRAMIPTFAALTALMAESRPRVRLEISA